MINYLHSPKRFVNEFLKATKAKDAEAIANIEQALKTRFSGKSMDDEDGAFVKETKVLVDNRDRNRYLIANAYYRAGLYLYAEHLLGAVPEFCGSGNLNLHASTAHRLDKLSVASDLWNRALEQDPEFLPAIDGLLSIYKALGNRPLAAAMKERQETARAGLNPTAFDLYALTVSKPWKALKRFGGEADGGYLIMEQDGGYDCFVSGGIGRYVQFEEQICSTFNVDCQAFDPTVPGLPENTSKRVHFLKKGVGNKETADSTNLSTYLGSHKDVFVKVDIEGSEYNWVESLSDDHLRNIKQIVLEWHHPFTKRRLACIAKLAKTHALVHVHPNNVKGCRKIAGIEIPTLFETTFVRKDVPSSSIVPNATPLPHPLDRPNVATKPEIPLTWWPFVTV